VKLVRGEKLVLRGSIPTPTTTTGYTKRINFFDGDYSHGYRVTKFLVGNNASSGNDDVLGKLQTADPANPSDVFWNWGNTQEIAWAAFEMLATSTPNTRGNPYTLVAADNLVIEDLYITVRSRGTGSPETYYYIEMDKYELAPMQGTLSIVGNMSQG